MKKLVLTAVLLITLSISVHAQGNRIFIKAGATQSNGDLLIAPNYETEVEDISPSIGFGIRFSKYLSASFQYDKHEYDYSTVPAIDGSGDNRFHDSRSVSSLMINLTAHPFSILSLVDPFITAGFGVGKDIPRQFANSDLDNPLVLIGAGLELRVTPYISVIGQGSFFRVSGQPQRDFQRIFTGIQFYIPQ